MRLAEKFLSDELNSEKFIGLQWLVVKDLIDLVVYWPIAVP